MKERAARQAMPVTGRYNFLGSAIPLGGPRSKVQGEGATNLCLRRGLE